MFENEYNPYLEALELDIEDMIYAIKSVYPVTEYGKELKYEILNILYLA